MFRVRDRWVRIVLAVTLFLLVGLGSYWIGVRIWAGRQYRAAEDALRRYDFEEAGACLESYLSLRPNDPDGWFLAAQTARRRGDFQAAMSRFREAEKHGASAEGLATERDLIRIQSGDVTNSNGLVRFCAEHPDDPEATLALEVLIEGNLKALRHRAARWAVDLWLAHRRSAAGQVRGLIWRGQVNLLAEDSPQALADFRQALELAPDHIRARILLTETLIRADPRQAAPQLAWLRRQRPHDPEVQFLTARLHRTLGNPEEAARLLDDILDSAPNHVGVLVERGRVALDLNHPEQAERWLLRALSLAPEQREVNLALSDCLRQAGRLDEARRYLEKAREIEARLDKVLDTLTGDGKPTGGQPRPASP
jgi:tetratricopeptide (TPR) repeat protein